MAIYATADNAGVFHRRCWTKTTRTSISRSVASFTRHCGRQVIDGFSHRCYPGKCLTVMAIGATADNTCVFHQTACESTEGSISRSVAGLARGTGWHVVCWLGFRRHSNSKCLAVVASCTAAAYANVAHFSGIRTKRGMTG